MDSEEHAERRQRHRVQLEAELVRLDGSTTRTIVSDLSLDGCRVAGWFLIGDSVTLRLPQIGNVRGQVRWALNGRAGVRFLPSAEG
jgi:hypothetical protein